VLQQLEALGLNVPAVLQQLGVRSTALEPSPPAAPPPSVPVSAPTHRPA
jgi:hypothetical protein